MIWSATLPLRPEHKLSERAAEQLLELLPGTRVVFGQPLDRTRMMGDVSDVIGSVKSAEPAAGNKVRVVLRFQEHDEMARIAFEGLEKDELGVGLDVQVSEAVRDGETINVGQVTGLAAVVVVPYGKPSRYARVSDPTSITEDWPGD